MHNQATWKCHLLLGCSCNQSHSSAWGTAHCQVTEMVKEMLALVFVSPELSSGRDLVIQMSVRRPPSAVRRPWFFVRSISGEPYDLPLMIFGMWVGLGLKLGMLSFGCGRCLKYLICIIYAKICPEHFWGTVCPTWMILSMWVGLGLKVPMVTLMEVKGHQRSNGVNYVLWLPYLVRRSPDASWEWWWPWWRSKVIRGQMG